MYIYIYVYTHIYANTCSYVCASNSTYANILILNKKYI